MSIIPSQTKVYSGFDPRTIPGCQLWLDGTDPNGNGSVPANGASLSTWVDKSGSGNTLTAAGSPLPTYISSSRTISYDGSSYFQKASLSFTAYTLFIIANKTSGNGPLYTNTTTTPYSGFFQNLSGNYYLIRNNTTGTDWATGASPFINGTSYLYSIQYASDNNVNVWSNGGVSAAITTTQTGTITQDSFLLGKRNSASFTDNWIGTFSEVIQYNTTLTTAQRQQIEGYLAWKWGLKANLPATHPFKLTPIVSRPFQPVDIAGCQLWLDAADASSLTLSGSSVTAWRDKSGIGYSGTFSAGRNFTYATNIRNGLNVVQTATGQTMQIPNFSIGATMSLFHVYMPISSTNGSAFIELGTNVNSVTGFYCFSQGNFNFAINNNGSIPYANFGNTSTSDTWEMIEAINKDPNASSTMSYYSNGTLKASGGNTTTDITLTKTLFINGRGDSNTLSYPTYIGEIIIYNVALTNSQRQQVEGYLANKWGLRSNLPSTHAYKIVPAITLPFNPANISGLQLWLDAADPNGTGIAPANNTVITTWVDKSGNAKNATATNGASYVTNGINKFGALYFDGTLDRRYGNTSLLITNNTVFAFLVFVSSMNSGSEGMRFLAFQSTTSGVGDYNSNNTGILFIYDTNRMQAYRNNQFTANLTCPAVGTPVLSTTYYNSSNGYNSLNGGTSEATMTSGANFNTTGGYVLAYGNINMKGYIGEIILYNTNLTTIQRQQVEGYLAAKWGIQGNILSTHPFKRIPP